MVYNRSLLGGALSELRSPWKSSSHGLADGSPHPDFHSRFPLKGTAPRGISGPNQAQGPLSHHHSSKGSPTLISGHVSSSSNASHSLDKAPQHHPPPTLAESSHLNAAQLSCLAHIPPRPRDWARGGSREGLWLCTKTGGN